nr:S8 family serine peptidase [Candidatus Freyarchaeota archaeon]
MKMCRKRTKNLILLITVILVLSVSLLLAFNQQPITGNTLTIPTQPTSPTGTTSPTSTNSKMGTHLQQLLQTSDPSTEYEMIIFFEKTVNYTQGINLLKNLEDFEILSNYTILDGVCIKAPIRMAETIAQQNYVQSITYNEQIKLAPNQITTDEIQAKDTNVNTAIGATTLQNPPYNLNGTGVVVAVLDTGINPHTYLDGSRIICNMTFTGEATAADQNGHGTAVAGIIGASGGPAKGVAPAVEFLNLKVLNASGIGESDWLTKAIDEALNGTVHPKADIISLSLGDPEGTSNDLLSNAVNDAWINGTIVVAAAGNEGGDGWNIYYETINSPGLGAYIITVGSLGGFNYGSVSYFSSRGPTDDNRSKPDIVAPGENIYTLKNDGSGYRFFSGTSASTPVVSGAMALLLDDNSNVSGISPNTTKAAIMMTANDLGLNPFSQGAGLINIYRAYNYLQGYYNGTNSTLPLIITPIRAITPPMTLSNVSDTIFNLTIIVGNISGPPITDVYFSVSGNASAFITTLPAPINGTLNDTQIFVQIGFRVPPNMSASDFSGTLMFFNVSGESLFNITLSLTSEIPLWIYLLPLFFLSIYHPVNLWAISCIVGIAAVAVIALVAIVRAGRRKPKPPPEFFEFGQVEGPPPSPPPPPEPEPDWFT